MNEAYIENQIALEQEEYETRKFYFRTIFRAITPKWEIGQLSEIWYGPESEYDKLMIPYLEKLELLRVVKTDDKPYEYSIEPDYEEIKRRRIFNQTSQKETKKINEEKRYLKSGY
jgi:hypothetical protein